MTCSNDKVSAKAHELRQKWIKQSNEQPADSGTISVLAAVVSCQIVTDTISFDYS